MNSMMLLSLVIPIMFMISTISCRVINESSDDESPFSEFWDMVDQKLENQNYLHPDGQLDYWNMVAQELENQNDLYPYGQLYENPADSATDIFGDSLGMIGTGMDDLAKLYPEEE